ncbi:hypothetical protein FHS42_004638 [Streptomyces zagrosensis]|uniref:Uncharacterized protein n=1 Tax=Streptomyces zagrosensis TaxID=1042984 RepID=A0A7W9QE45_9ACTN|nr:hypothetical protein [Streptomyces zagrosensis]
MGVVKAWGGGVLTLARTPRPLNSAPNHAQLEVGFSVGGDLATAALVLSRCGALFDNLNAANTAPARPLPLHRTVVRAHQHAPGTR